MIYFILLIVSLCIILFIGWFIAFSIYHPKTHDFDQTYQWEVEKDHLNKAYISNFTVKKVSIQSEKLTLKADYIDQGSNKTILLMHGHTYTRYGSYKYAPMFLEKGYNLLMPDQRFHGQSEGKNTTLGLQESIDCKNWIRYIKETTPTVQTIGLHGESMGAATVLHAASNNHDIDFVISDCAFSDFSKQVQYIIKKQHRLPKPFVYIAEVFSKLFHTSILNNKPVESIQNIDVPILLIHGKVDTFIPIAHFNDLKAHLKETDQTYLCDGANHAMSYETNPSKYKDKVYQFLQTI